MKNNCMTKINKDLKKTKEKMKNLYDKGIMSLIEYESVLGTLTAMKIRINRIYTQKSAGIEMLGHLADTECYVEDLESIKKERKKLKIRRTMTRSKEEKEEIDDKIAKLKKESITIHNKLVKHFVEKDPEINKEYATVMELLNLVNKRYENRKKTAR